MERGRVGIAAFVGVLVPEAAGVWAVEAGAGVQLDVRRSFLRF